MTEEFPSRYDHKKGEPKIYELWEKSGYFAPENLPAAKIRNSKLEIRNFSIHLPPPNITGSLHLGHALNATISDVLIRYHRMRGEKTVWFPGIDHAGIATQNVVEKELKKDGETRWGLGREKFVERVWRWKEKYGGIILEQLKKLGASCDWSRTRFTMDENYAEDVQKAFIHYYDKGLIYRGKRVINWCPRCATGLSDLEIQYVEEKTKLWHIRYPIALRDKRPRAASLRGKHATSDKDYKDYIVVATTRPETMLGDSAVAVNPKDKRYKKLVGKKVELPIRNREIPIIADEAIDQNFGTGAVKITPAHDILDSEIGERNNLAAHEIIDERARMTKEAGEKIAGLKVKEARGKVVEELIGLGLLEKTEDYTHNLATCYRCGTTLEPLLSNQWFLKMTDLAKKAADSVSSGRTEIIPKNFGKIYFSWLENIKDWCISRQLWWGHRLPAWFHEEKCIPKMENGKWKMENGVDKMKKCKEVVVSVEKPKCKYCDAEYKQSEDVLDTWFSSALWPFAGLKDEELKEFYPSNILITARDIINLWVGRMIFSGLEFHGKEPFPETLIHATILTKDGRRMSKSLGTGIDPLALIEQNGADATRFGLIWQAMGTQDIHWDETAIMAGKKFVTKIWNAARFTIMNSSAKEDYPKEMPAPTNENDKKICELLEKTRVAVGKQIDGYEFGQALHSLYDFFWHEFCDKYIEQSKNQPNSKVVGHVLVSSLKMLHPFMPFVTEEIYQRLRPGKMLIIEKW